MDGGRRGVGFDLEPGEGPVLVGWFVEEGRRLGIFGVAEVCRRLSCCLLEALRVSVEGEHPPYNSKPYEALLHP